MDFLYDFFYEVFSEEGIWVLILIASAFAVASFILLTLRMDTSPRRAGVPRAKNNSKPKKEKKTKKENKKGEDTITGQEEIVPEVKETTSELEVDVALNPEMIPPATLAHPEVVLPGAASYKNVPQPFGEQPSALAAEPLPGQIIDPFEVAPLAVTEQKPVTGVDLPTAQDTGQVGMAGAGVSGGAVIAGGMAEMPGNEGLFVLPKSEAESESESEDEDESESGEKSGDDDLFNIMGESGEEQTDLAEFAKSLDEVVLSGLLTETEDLSSELKDIFTRQGRRQ